MRMKPSRRIRPTGPDILDLLCCMGPRYEDVIRLSYGGPFIGTDRSDTVSDVDQHLMATLRTSVSRQVSALPWQGGQEPR
jgi:hypothetical protein